MAERPFTQADLDALAQWDTPTICNGLEITSPERRAFGYTVEPMVSLDPKAKPIVGVARVGMIRSTEPPRGKVVGPGGLVRLRRRHRLPDHCGDPGHRWPHRLRRLLGRGAVHHPQGTGLDRLRHQRLVPRPGYVGGRLSDDRRPGRPEPRAGCTWSSSARPVNIFGMQAGHDDVIHADFHGAVVVPADAVKKLPAAIDLISRREKVILDVCRSPDFTPREAARGAETVGGDPLIA